MSLSAEHRALVFVAAIAALGVVARLSRSRDPRGPVAATDVAALDAQIARVDSARRGVRAPVARATRRGPAGGRDPGRERPAPAPRPPVDLDTADAGVIEGLPWVGPALAARIIDNRARCGPFGSLDALQRVSGIGEGMARRLAPHVTFSTASRPRSAALTSGCQGAARGAAPRRRGRS